MSIGRGQWWLVLVVLLLLTRPGSAPAGAPPEVVRVRVPAPRVGAYFPPGSAVRTLAPDQFEALVTRAQLAASVPGPPATSRPIRIEHSARWDGATLAGQSRVTLPATLGSDRPLVLLLDPWSPAVLATPDRSDLVRVDDSGRLLVVQPARQAARIIDLHWSQTAQFDSLGQVFALHLPAADLASLALDLPAGMVPLAGAAVPGARAALPTDPAANRSRWEFAGATGRFPIQLVPSGTVAPASPASWVGGMTRIDLNSTGANWVAEWQVEGSGGRLAPTCRIELDPGLELIDVAGPTVQGFRLLGPAGAAGSARVEVTLQTPEAIGSQVHSLTIRAHAPVPLTGIWSIPAARPGGGMGWLGGRTEVRLDPARAVVATVERGGRRVAARPGDSLATALWIFEDDGRPGPLADLHLAAPEPSALVAIDGTLRLGAFAPRIEVSTTWTVDRGRLLDPALDVPAGWVVDGVTADEDQGRTPWHLEALPGGASRVHLDGAGWSADPPGRAVVLRLAATRIESAFDPVGPLDLPRVRPATGSTRVAAERWVALVDRGWEVVPTTARGLAWDDLAPLGPADAEPSYTGLMRQLTWRWVAVDAAATVTRRRVAEPPHLDERLEATISGGRLRLVWFWTLAALGRPDAVPFGLDLDPVALPRWRLAAPSGGLVVAARPVTGDRRAALGLPPTDLAAEVPTAGLPPGPVTLRGETEVAWSGVGSIPLTQFPATVQVRRSVVVRVADSTRFRVDRADGLRPVARGEVGDPATTPESESSPFRALVGDDEVGLRVAGVWLAEAANLRLDVATPGDPDPVGPVGVITEASLTSRLTPGSVARHRLVLRVVPGSTRILDLQLPAGALLDRVRRDGQPAVVLATGSTLRVTLARSDPTRLTSTTTLDYRTAADPSALREVHPARLLPTMSLACLSFTWQVNAPDRFGVQTESVDLVPTDLVDQAARLGSEPITPATRPAESGPDAAVLLADLDRSLTLALPVETTLGAWLTKLDAGQWPIVVDRLALLSVGQGPRSRVNIVATDLSRPSSATAVFQSLGLAVEPVGAALLVTTEADRRNDGGLASLTAERRTALGQTLVEASMNGSDRSDRFQAPARWHGEPTPRAWLASETPDRGLVAAGWQTHRFAASTWPTPSTSIQLVDARAPWQRIGAVTTGCAVLALLIGSARLALRRGRWSRVFGLVLVASTATWSASGQFDPTGPIVAVLPYDDLAQLASPADRVLLLEADHDRLLRLATPVELARPSGATSLAVTHHVDRLAGGRVARVETRTTLEVAGPLAATWSWPVGPAFDLTATTNDQPVPLRISSDGRTATIEAIPAGRSQVVIRRLVPVVSDQGRATAEAGGGSIRLPITRAAFARVEVEAGRWTGPIILPGLVGATEATPGGVGGDLGPLASLTVRWGPADSDPNLNPRPEIETLVRWDAGVAGDRLTTRFTVAGSAPLRSLRLALEPGLAVVGQAIPGLVGTTTGGTIDRPEWVAHLDPPLLPGAAGEWTGWRPRPALPAATGSTRSLPRVELVGGRETGLIGLRIPEEATGRFLGAGPTAVGPTGESDFGRAWGAMPPDGFLLASTSRRDPTRTVTALVSPAPTGLHVRDQVTVAAVPGTLEVVVESVLTDPSRPVWEAEATFAGPVRLVRVAAADLAHWTQPAPDRVRLVFDAAKPNRERSVHLEGVVETGPVGPDAAVAALVPWPQWDGAGEAEPGKLVVQAPEGWLVRAGDDVVAASPANPNTPDQRSYSIRPRSRPIRLGGPAVPPREHVLVASDLRLDVGQAVWAAEVACEVMGGSVATLHWKLPTAWAERATLRASDGSTPAVEAEVRGDSTFWTIRLDRPIWSRRTLLIHAKRPLGPGQTLDYPAILPLSPPGRGTVARYDLTITNLAGTVLGLVSPTGLTPLNHARVRSAVAAVPSGIVSRAFRVASEPWSLGLRLAAEASGAPPRPGEADDTRRLARVEQVDFQVTINTAGRITGRAECRVQPGAAFLAVRFSSLASLVGAAVDGQAATPVAVTPGPNPSQWLIPLGDHVARRVVLGWVMSPTPMTPDLKHSPAVYLPTFDQTVVPASLQVAATGRGGKLNVTGKSWTRLAPAAAAVGEFERLGADLIAAIDRAGRESTPTEASAIQAGLTTMALDRRAADRRARLNADNINPRAALARWQATQSQVQTALVEAGLGSLLDEANQRVGLASTIPDPTRSNLGEEVADPYRVRRIGVVEHFSGTITADPTQTSVVTISPGTP